MIGFAAKFRKSIIHNDMKKANDTKPKQPPKKEEPKEEPKEESSD